MSPHPSDPILPSFMCSKHWTHYTLGIQNKLHSRPRNMGPIPWGYKRATNSGGTERSPACSLPMLPRKALEPFLHPFYARRVKISHVTQTPPPRFTGRIRAEHREQINVGETTDTTVLRLDEMPIPAPIATHDVVFARPVIPSTPQLPEQTEPQHVMRQGHAVQL